jgi:hypothetical protein
MENIGVLIGLGVTVYLIYDVLNDVLRSRGGDEKKVSFMMKKKVKR